MASHQAVRQPRSGPYYWCMDVAFIGLLAVFVLGLVILLPIWPWGRTASGADWRALYESAMSERNPNAVLGGNIYIAEKAVRLRQKEIRSQPPDSSERLELARAQAALIDRKAKTVRWFRSGLVLEPNSTSLSVTKRVGHSTGDMIPPNRRVARVLDYRRAGLSPTLRLGTALATKYWCPALTATGVRSNGLEGDDIRLVHAIRIVERQAAPKQLELDWCPNDCGN